jgi:hypothetical protein
VEICTVGSVRGESVGAAMVDLYGHEAGNGGYSQGTPTGHRPLSYSERLPIFRLPRLLGKARQDKVALSPSCRFLARLCLGPAFGGDLNSCGSIAKAFSCPALGTRPNSFAPIAPCKGGCRGFSVKPEEISLMCRWENSGAQWQKDNREIGKIKPKTYPQTATVGHPPRSLKLRGVKGSCNLRAAVQDSFFRVGAQFIVPSELLRSKIPQKRRTEIFSGARERKSA